MQQRSNRGLNAATKRWGTLTRQQLEEFLQRVRSVSQNLEMLLPSLPLSEHAAVRIDGATKGERGMELLEDYAVLVNEAVTN